MYHSASLPPYSSFRDEELSLLRRRNVWKPEKKSGLNGIDEFVLKNVSFMYLDANKAENWFYKCCECF